MINCYDTIPRGSQWSIDEHHLIVISFLCRWIKEDFIVSGGKGVDSQKRLQFCMAQYTVIVQLQNVSCHISLS